MRRWTLRLVWAMTCGAAMPALAQAQNENFKMDTMKTPPHAAVVVADPCPYRAATPYNAIVVNRPVPTPALNMPNYVLSCEIPKQNLDAYVAPPCNCGCNRGGGCGGGCNNGCGSIFGSCNFNRGCGSNSCNTGCGNSCDGGYRGWQRFSCGSSNNCGCNTGCGGCNNPVPAVIPAPAAIPATPAAPISGLKPVGDFEQVGWFIKSSDPKNPVNDCLQCPQNGPQHKCKLPTPGTLGCTGCSTWESEHVFIFGTCRQFFGEPTHCWLTGK
jgi:hypothetical protein